MTLLERLHGRFVSPRRVRVLCERLAEQVPSGARLLDVGCGSGAVARELTARRPDLSIVGVDVFVRENACIPVVPFDGRTLPFADASFDVVLFVDVLHHTDDPMVLLREAGRVARQTILIKDHASDRPLAAPLLRLMDRLGNPRNGVAIPGNYWPRKRWLAAFEDLGLRLRVWSDDLGLYPPPAGWIVGGSLHFLARLATRSSNA